VKRFFKSSKSEWVKQTEYRSFIEVKTAIIDYIIEYYSQVRPHQHNDGKVPNVAVADCWNEYCPVVKIT